MSVNLLSKSCPLIRSIMLKEDDYESNIFAFDYVNLD